MRKNIDLVNGPVLKSLTQLAVPIMATSLIQTAYNLTDMLWIGRVGSNAVASVGAAGMYMWLSNGLAALPKWAVRVNVGHVLGAGRPKDAANYATAALHISIIFGLVFGLVCILFSNPLIGFFNLTGHQVIADARIYLKITCGCVIFSFLNQTPLPEYLLQPAIAALFYGNFNRTSYQYDIDPVLIFDLTISCHGCGRSGYRNCTGTGDSNPYLLCLCQKRQHYFLPYKTISNPGQKSFFFYCQNRIPNLHTKYDFYRYFHDHCPARCRIWRCRCCSAKSWFTD